MKRVAIPPEDKARIYTVRDMMNALTAAGKRAKRRMIKAAAKHGEASGEYQAAKAGYEEMERNLPHTYIVLDIRKRELEAPYKREGRSPD